METIQIEDGFKVPADKGKILLLLLGCIAFVAVSAWLLQKKGIAEDEVLFVKGAAVAGCLFAGVGVIVFTVGLFSSNLGLYITSKGIDFITPFNKTSFVAWNEISGFNIMQVKRTKLLLVMLKDPKEYLKRKSSLTRWMGSANASIGGTPYSINSNMLKCNFDELTELMQTNFEKFK